MAKWRFLEPETHDAFMNMAIDEAIMTNRIAGNVPNTARLYYWKPSAVSIGKFQSIEKEVQVGHCKSMGIDVVRRISGGGTVYHDSQGEITYGITAEKKDLNTQDLTAIYARIYAGISTALGSLGIEGDFSEGNAKTCPNLTVDGKKISGSAQCHKKNVVLQHGTLLIDVDFQKMFTILRVPWTDSCIKAADAARRKITSIKTLTNTNLTTDKVVEALRNGFSKTFAAEMIEGQLTEQERELASKLKTRKYSNDKWNLHGQAC